jgi:flavodoxin
MTYTKGIRKIFASSVGDLECQLNKCVDNGFDLLAFNGKIFFVFRLGDNIKWEPTSLNISDFEA